MLDALRREAREQGPLADDGLFVAGDWDAGAVKATRDNAKRAGVLHAIAIDGVSFEKREPPAESGLLVANPPYGERIEGGHTDWAAMARVLRDGWGGWRVVPLFPPSAKRSLSALELDEEAAFKTGGIAARVLVGDVPGR